MPTRKKKTASPKNPKKTVKKSPASKAATKKPAAKKTTAKKAPAKKAAPKKPASQKSQPAGPREQKLSNEALKMVDQAAALLRKGIRSSASTSEKTRLEAKHQAHSLLNKASSSLGDILSGSTSVLRGVINKI